MEENDGCTQNESTQDPEGFSTILGQQTTDPTDELERGVDPSDPIKHGVKQSDTVYHTSAESDFISIASIETQPALYYNQAAPLYSSYDYSYDPDKVSSYPSTYYGYDNYGIDYSNVKNSLPTDAIHTQAQKLHTTSDVGAPHTVAQHSEVEPQDSCLAAQQQSGNKVVAVNPVILVDKVERSLIVQWYENNIRREQRISYKKYGNAKAQQRAESLINKLLAGSTFDQLYPEKGPPILTIFENVGEYMVSLTRDRIQREWRVDWVNSNGVKMRARWSCKKVGNEEARKRADTFANSLIQGVFNPRLLHKATGTRLSRNDMKYNAVINTTDYGNFTTKKTVSVGDDGVVDVAPKRTTLRRTKSESTGTTTTRRRRSNVTNSSVYGGTRSHAPTSLDYGMYKGAVYPNHYYVYPHPQLIGGAGVGAGGGVGDENDLINMASLKNSQVPSPLPDPGTMSSSSHSSRQPQQQQNWSRWHMGASLPEWDYQYYGMPPTHDSIHQMAWLSHYMPSMDMVSIDEQSTDSARLGYYHPHAHANAHPHHPCYTETKVDASNVAHDPLGYYDMATRSTMAPTSCYPTTWQDFEKSCHTVTPTTRSNEPEGADSHTLQQQQQVQTQQKLATWPSLKETGDEQPLVQVDASATGQDEDVYQQVVQQQQQQQQQQQSQVDVGYLYPENPTSSGSKTGFDNLGYYNTLVPYSFIK